MNRIPESLNALARIQEALNYTTVDGLTARQQYILELVKEQMRSGISIDEATERAVRSADIVFGRE